MPEPEPEVEEPEPKVEELLIGTLVDLPAGFTIELLLSSPAMRIPVSLRSPDLYDLYRSFYMKESHRRSGYSRCDVQLIRFSPGRMRFHLLLVQ